MSIQSTGSLDELVKCQCGLQWNPECFDACPECGRNAQQQTAMQQAASLKSQLSTIRTETIEMCAKVAETMKSGPVYFVEGRPHAGVVVGGDHIAAAIRALSQGEKS